jgi:hypothetical protein
VLQLVNQVHPLYVDLMFLILWSQKSTELRFGANQIKQFPSQSGNALTWTADLPAGTSLCVHFHDCVIIGY